MFHHSSDCELECCCIDCFHILVLTCAVKGVEGATSREREAEEQAERERLRKQWLKEQERIRSEFLFTSSGFMIVSLFACAHIIATINSF